MLCGHCQNHQVSQEGRSLKLWCIFTSMQGFCWGRIPSNYLQFWREQQRTCLLGVNIHFLPIFDDFISWWCSKTPQAWSFYLPTSNITPCAVCTKLCWSKNAMEEHDAQTQVLLGSEDPDYCVLTAMGAWLEIYFCPQPDDDNPFFYGIQAYSNADSIKHHYSNAVRSIVFSETYHPRNGCCILGTHSNQKYAVTEAQSNAY